MADQDAGSRPEVDLIGFLQATAPHLATHLTRERLAVMKGVAAQGEEIGRLEARIDSLERELAARERVGRQMSNLCFNIRQRGAGGTLTERDCENMTDLYREWDAPRALDSSSAGEGEAGRG